MISRSGRSRRALAAAVAPALLGALLWLPALGPAALAAGESVDLDQWANLDGAWQNGNLNGNNARYPEGGVIPFRLALESLEAGDHTITISYDFTASGHKAYDFLASWNGTHRPGLCLPSGGAISSLCPSLPDPSSHAFPADPYAANGLSVSGAQAWSGVPRRLTIYGGTIVSIGAPAHRGSPDGNSTGDLRVRFHADGDAVLLAWGGHLAHSSWWDTAGGGQRDGASLVSGAPWHMRTLGLDGGGNRNQDRSIQPSAVVGELPPAAVAATPRPPAPGQTPAIPTGTGPRPTVPPTATEARLPASRDRGPAGAPVTLGIAFAAGIALLVLARPARRRR